MPDTSLEMKGLSTLLFIIGTKIEKATVQEVQCLHADGYMLHAAANSDIEVGALAAGLGAAGIPTEGALAELRTCFLVVRDAQDATGFNPSARAKTKSLWTDSASYSAAGLVALGVMMGWEAEYTAALAAKKVKEKTRTPTQQTAFDNFETDWNVGRRRFKILDNKAKEVGFPATKWSKQTPTALLRASGERHLRLVKTSKGGDGSGDMHAEQSLLFAYAEHLRLSGTAVDISVAGQKPPCAGCEPVLAAFKAAYKEVYGKELHTNDSGSATSKANTGKLALTEPASTDTGTAYARFVAAYKKAL